MTEADRGGTSFAAKASDDIDKAKHRLEEEKRAAEDLAEEAKGAATGLGAKAKEAVYRQGEEVRGEAVSHLRHFADVVRNAGDELAEKEPGVVSDVVREAARGLESLSDTLSRKSPAEVFGSIREFGQRHPGAFLAGSVLAGFAIARFATTASPRSGPGGPRPAESYRPSDRPGPSGFHDAPAAVPGSGSYASGASTAGRAGTGAGVGLGGGTAASGGSASVSETGSLNPKGGGQA
jgi:hypothetical protein